MLDRRINAFRPDLAETGLQSQVDAQRFVTGEPGRIGLAKISLRPKPTNESGIDTELLYGEPVTVLDRRDGWAWVKSGLDAYVGYIEEDALGHSLSEPTHWITAPRTFVYPEPDMKKPVVQALSMGSRIAVIGEAETRGTRYLLVKGGAVIASHAGDIEVPVASDYVAIAARFLETPYLWGGRSGFGLDCSGLVQLSMMMTGKQAPRDSDMQMASLGQQIAMADLTRGDLVFWKGHVAIMEDRQTMIHANGYTMSVARERLADAIDRIAPLYGQPLICRRPQRHRKPKSTS